MTMESKREIRGWMLANRARFTDRRTGEFLPTEAVEAWDYETQDGAMTVDPDHPAWEVAADLSYRFHPTRHHVVEGRTPTDRARFVALGQRSPS
jgi:hypothetical protein